MGCSALIPLCFVVFGITGIIDPVDRFNLLRLALGGCVGACFGMVYKFLLSLVLGVANRKLRREHGPWAVRRAVLYGMAFLVPFALMALAAAYALHWTALAAFVSTGLMTASVAAAVELGRVKGRQDLKDVALASVVASLLGTIWVFSLVPLNRLPLYLEGAVQLLKAGGNLFQ